MNDEVSTNNSWFSVAKRRGKDPGGDNLDGALFEVRSSGGKNNRLLHATVGPDGAVNLHVIPRAGPSVGWLRGGLNGWRFVVVAGR